jgi:serine/threonine-protein kinase HipA
MRKLEVHLSWGRTESHVGTLAEENRRIFFEYSDAFLDNPLPISPFFLPVRPGLFQEKEGVYDGLLGVFNDSLPDGWGLLLMDREFRRRGLDAASVTPLDRLAFVGTRAVGALTYRPPWEEEEEPSPMDLGRIADQAERVLRGSQEEILPELLLAGGSPGGARPKVLVGFHEETGEMISGTSSLPPGFRHFMVKFGTEEDGPEMGAVEAAYARMAAAAGISVPRTRLFDVPEGRRYFGAERFDREGDARLHAHTLGGLLHASHRIPSVEYDAFLRATLELTKDYRQLLEAYRRMTFNVFAHIRDDHTKNFSFLMDSHGEWTLAPAYDLVFSHGIAGWHTMAVAGEALNPGREELLNVGESCGVERKAALNIQDQVREAVAGWNGFSEEMEVAEPVAEEIERKLSSLMDRVDRG